MNLKAMPLRVSVKNCRAVHDADIALAGLTIICGNNGVGKSTIARITQDSVEALLYYVGSRRLLLTMDLQAQTLAPLVGFLRTALGIDFPGDDALVRTFSFSVDRSMTVQEWVVYYDGLKKSVDKCFNSSAWKTVDSTTRAFLQLGIGLGGLVSAHDVEQAVRSSIDRACQLVMDAENEQISCDEYSRSVSSVLWEGDVDVFENEELIWSYRGRESLRNGRIASVENVIYIQSPIKSVPQYKEGGLSFADNLVVLPIGGKHVPSVSQDDFLAKFATMVSGNIVLGKDKVGNPMWIYNRRDGRSIPLDTCASGFKSLSILGILHNYKYLGNTTVLIVDEPEAHLHPEWIVEYAYILVQLVRKLNVRILVASHNPDMVNALKSFAQAADIADVTKIYQAVPAADGTEYQYDFEDRHLSVEDIFDSFNRVYDLIAEKVEMLKQGLPNE